MTKRFVVDKLYSSINTKEVNKTQITIILLTIFASISSYLVITTLITIFAIQTPDYYFLSHEDKVTVNKICSSPTALCRQHIYTPSESTQLLWLLVFTLVEISIIGGGITLLRRVKKYPSAIFKPLWTKLLIGFDWTLIGLFCLGLLVHYLFGL